MNKGFGEFEGLDEATLLAFVEGTISSEQSAAFLHALQGRPHHAQTLRTLEKMRRDREAVMRLPEVMAPAGLVEAAIARAQREALLSLRSAGEQSDEIPVSRVIPIRRSWWSGTRAAIAAAAVLGIASGAVIIGFWPATKPAGPLVAQGPGPSAISTPEAPRPRPTPIVLEQDPAPETPAPLLAIANEAAMVPLAPRQSIENLGEAVELAKAGRLVIRVTARNPARCEQQIASIATRSESSRLWRASAQAPVEIRTALASRSSTPSAIRPFEPAMADGQRRPGWLILRPSQLELFTAPREEDLISMVRLSPTEDAIRALRTTLGEQVGAVTLSELAEPAPEVREDRTVDSALWWSGSPTQWARWSSVPVIIER